MIDDLIDAVIDREGGYVHHPADRGGATRYGITEAVARANGYAGDMRHFARPAALAIYRRLYWTRPGFDRIVISYALSMIPPWEAVTAQAIARLSPGGSLHLVDFGDQAGLPPADPRAG